MTEPGGASKGASWRDGFAAGEVIQRIRPRHTSDYLNNPHKGTATFQRFNGDPLYPALSWDDAHGPETFNPPANADLHNDRYPPTRIAYCRWTWACLEPRKGQFRFDLIDKALQTAAARGQTLQLRAQPMAGGVECPQWYWDLGARTDPTYPRKNYRMPDHNDPLYFQHWSDHIRALGQRYDGHPALESFDIAYGGGCGETGGNADCLTSRKLAQVYLDSFPDTQLLGMLETEGCRYALGHRLHRAGWRFDCYGDCTTDGLGVVPDGLRWNHMYDWWPAALFADNAQETWKTAPVTLETCWTVPYWFNQGWDIDWIIDQGLKYHPSVFMPKSVHIPEQWMDKIVAFSQRIGYWFHLHQMILPLEARPGQPVEAAVVIDNKAAAPIYRPYRFALRFSQGRTHKVVRLRQDIRAWMPDLTQFAETFTFPAGLTRGEAKVSCGIVDAGDKPVVRLAIKDVDADGWHGLTSIDVLE